MKKFISILLSALLITSVICSAPFVVSAIKNDKEIPVAAYSDVECSVGTNDENDSQLEYYEESTTKPYYEQPTTSPTYSDYKTGTTGNCTWSLDDEGTLTVSGNGEMDNYSYGYDSENDSYYTTAPWGATIKSVVIENGVTNIGECAFYGCKGLTSITIPDGVTSIGDYAFYGCTGLTSVTIPNSVTSIGDDAFEDCTGLTSVTIPDSVTSIGYGAFYCCTGLTSITIPDGVTSIGISAFERCTGLTSITISDSVTSIGSYAFSDTEWYNNQPDGLIYAGKVAYEYMGIMPSNTSIAIKEGTKGIAGSAFECCTGLTSITIPDSVTSIDGYAFYGCKGLTSITIPNSVTSIGYGAFRGCTGLTSITIPDSVTSIEYSAFEGCTGLTSIIIPDSVTSIGHSAFKNTAWYNNQSDGLIYAGKVVCGYKGTMPNNTSIVIKEGTKGIADLAFVDFTSLTSVTIPDSVTNIGGRAFSGCIRLTSITIPDSVSEIGENAFEHNYAYDPYGSATYDNFIIYGYTGSYAEYYAKENGFNFVSIGATYIDEETNISVTADEGLTLQVVEKNETETGDIVLGQGEAIYSVYDISLLKDGSEVQPDGNVTVKIPCDNEGAKVYRVEHDKSLTDMNAVYENGYLVFTTEHFSLYVVSVPKTYTTGDVNGDNNVDVLDAAAVQKHASGISELNSEQLAAADVNGDGNVDVLDAADIQKFAAGIISEFKKKV